MAYNGINFDRARMGPRSGIIDPSRMGPPQVAVPGGSMRQAVVQQSNAPQSVADILSAGQPSMASPDLMGAQTSASRQRQIADMLMQGVQQQDNTSLAGGLSQLGQAFIARGAGKKADKAEAEAQSIQSLLVKQAMAGDQASIAQLLAGDPAAAINYQTQMDERKYARGRDALSDERYTDELGYARGRDGILDSRYETEQQRADRLELEDKRRFGLTYGLDLKKTNAAVAAASATGTSGTRQLSAEEAAAAGYPEGAVVQRDPKGKDTVVYKPPGEYSAGQINKYTNDAAQLEAYEATLNEYLSLVDRVGLKKFYSPDDPDVARLEAMQQSLSFGAKNLFQLGVLSKDDYEAVNRIIPDATGMEAMFKNKESFMASAQPLQDYIERSSNAIPEQFRSRSEAPTVDAASPAPSADGTLFKGGALSQIPPDAVAELLADPSPEKQRYFDQIFGPEQAQRLLAERGYASQLIKF